MGGIHPAVIELFSCPRQPVVLVLTDRDEPWTSLERLEDQVRREASDARSLRILMRARWGNEALFEELLGFFEGQSAGARREVEDDESCCWGVLHPPSDLAPALARLAARLGPPDNGDPDTAEAVAALLDFVARAALRRQWLVTTFCDPP